MISKPLTNNSLIIIPAIALLIILSLSFFSCTDDPWNENPDFRLEFSSDTVLFDTIFSSIGTATYPLTVYNRSGSRVKISNLELCGGQSSSYRININGNAVLQERDLEIGARDSIFVLVKVTIDPTNEILPFVVMDSLKFEVNGNSQFVKLLSWGQNANFLINGSLNENTTFTAGKPYLIYKQLTIANGITLNIEPGSKIFLHKDAMIVSETGSRILCRGTISEPVIFRGDNLVFEEKDTVPGQWSGIWLKSGSGGHVFENTRILNGEFGIWAEGDGNPNTTDLTLFNCTVHNMINYCLFLSSADVLSANSRFTSSGTNVVAFDGGGNYDFRHCTIGGFKTFDVTQPAEYSALYMSNYSYDNNYNIIPNPLSKAYFGNCIIDGNYREALETDIKEGTTFNPVFENSLVRTSLSASNPAWFVNCKYKNDTVFIDPYRNDYSLDTLSFAKDIGSMEVINTSILSVINDLRNVSRIHDLKPDAGCYERKED